MVLPKEKRTAVVNKFKKHETDTGSSEVQIGLLTARINSLIEHFKGNKKDQHSRRGLLVLVGKRKRHMKYLERKDNKKFKSVVKELGL
jgi:small subunit ribosomal protein S15